MLYNRYCIGEKSDKITQHVLKTRNFPACMQEMLKTGTADGLRNKTIIQLVVTLRRRGLSKARTLAVMKEWAKKSYYDERIEKRVAYLYENHQHISYDCQDCNNTHTCFGYTDPVIAEPDEFFDCDTVRLPMHENMTKKLAKPKRKGVDELSGKEIIDIGILKTHLF